MHFLKKGQKIRAWVDPAPLIRAMPERKHFFFIEAFPYWWSNQFSRSLNLTCSSLQLVVLKTRELLGLRSHSFLCCLDRLIDREILIFLRSRKCVHSSFLWINNDRLSGSCMVFLLSTRDSSPPPSC